VALITSPVRLRVLSIAAGQIDTRDPSPYFADAAPVYAPSQRSGKSWCRIFALWVYRKAGLTTKHWVDELGFESELPTIPRSQVKPGDMTILRFNSYGAEVWHGAIVQETIGDHTDVTIDGNTSDGVQRITRDIRDYRELPTYKSIQPWVDRVEVQQARKRGIALGGALVAVAVGLLWKVLRRA
jgi:hypothetical protein